jgi:Tol biopolymer transport system component
MDLNGQDLRSLTSSPTPDGPAVNRHKGFAHYHPSGRYIIMQVEMPEKLIGSSSSRVTSATEPGNAVWNDLWVVGVDGKGWTNLTNFTTRSLTGALSPYFSHDGRKLVYSTLRRAADKLHSFGYWDLHVADFVLEPEPHLSNDRILFSQEGIYEPHGFSPDDTHILFSSDRDLANRTQSHQQSPAV